MGPAISVDSASTAVEASQMMMKHYSSSVLVENKQTVMGIITMRDFMRVVTKEGDSPAEIKVYQLMSRPVITVDSTSTLWDAARIMSEKKIQSLPVLESDRYVGIISSPDIVRAALGVTPVQGIPNEESAEGDLDRKVLRLHAR